MTLPALLGLWWLLIAVVALVLSLIAIRRSPRPLSKAAAPSDDVAAEG